GIAPLGPGALLNAPGDLAISYTSAAFQPYADTVPDTVRFVGWTLNEAPEQDFAPPGKQLIYISLGTMNNKDAAFFQACIDAFAGQEQSVLITTGEAFDPAVFGPLPANIAIHPWLPQTAVLKRAALFVTHGGMNSLHDGLYCGVPLLLVPQQEEQTLNARRVAELGAGIVIKKDRAAAPLIRSAAARLLGTDSFRAAAQRLGATLREAGGAARAADEIEALLARAAQSGASPAAGH
ncbi:MAG TPA: nucleotide disphospho-sugar-binding domain-containing protein, partial [Herpetosiphonaceae bacterium]|nr:nucleotide disphospho-sugar-binding domain-containing protein [Herpetosiphonaceae bacterium]